MDESRTILSEADQLRHEELWGREDYFQNARKPVGEDGRIMIRRMNGGSHAQLAAWGFSLLDGIAGGPDRCSPQPEAILDAGCGGGANLARWMERCPDAHLTGLDFSPVSIDESRRFNSAEIASGRCTVVQGDVMDMPFADDTFDCVSAFETVYFWPDIARAFDQVKRALRPGGIFFICNESDVKEQPAIDASRIIRGMKLYTAEDLRHHLQQAGFHQIEILTLPGTHFLAAIAKKLLPSQD